MDTTAKKILNIALKVVTWLLVAFTVFMMIFTVVTVTTVDRNDRSIFGVKFYIVQTDSMSLSENNKDMDVHFNAGDIVIIKNVDDPRALQAGDVIAFMSTNSVSYGETVTHMIREIKKTEDGKVLGYAGAWLILDEGHIPNVAVTKERRGEGIGRGLMKALMQYAANMGVQYMTLEVRKSNLTAQKLYHSLGFIDLGVRKRYYEDNGEDALIMVCDHMPEVDPDFTEEETVTE